MNFTKNLLFIITVFALIFLSEGCKKDDAYSTNITPSLEEEVDSLLTAIAYADSVAYADSIQQVYTDSVAAVIADSLSLEELNEALYNSLLLPEEPTPIDPPEVYETTYDSPDPFTSCTTENIRWAPAMGEQLLLDPTSDVIWVGTPIKFESIEDGTYIPISLNDRAPYTISTSLSSFGDPVSDVVENATLSGFRTTHSNILGQLTNPTNPAQVSLKYEVVHSESHLATIIGAGLKIGKFFDVSGTYNFNNEAISTRVVIQLVQPYYSLDMDLPNQLTDWVNNPDNLDISNWGDYSPVYVSSIKYGRMAIMTIESSHDEEQVMSALTAGLNFWRVNGSFEWSNEDRQVLDESSIKALVIGGSGSDAVGVINGVEGLSEYILNGGDFSQDSPGAPLSYTLRFIKDNSVAKVQLSSEYNVRTCTTNEPEILSFLPLDGNREYMCFEHVDGDQRMGYPVRCTLNAELFAVGNSIYANISGFVDGDNDSTRGEVDRNIFLYEVPDNYELLGFESGTTSTGSIIDNSHDDIDHISVNNNGPVDFFEIMGKTDGKDLPCYIDAVLNGTSNRCHLRVVFKQVDLRVRRMN